MYLMYLTVYVIIWMYLTNIYIHIPVIHSTKRNLNLALKCTDLITSYVSRQPVTLVLLGYCLQPPPSFAQVPPSWGCPGIKIQGDLTQAVKSNPAWKCVGIYNITFIYVYICL